MSTFYIKLTRRTDCTESQSIGTQKKAQKSTSLREPESNGHRLQRCRGLVLDACRMLPRLYAPNSSQCLSCRVRLDHNRQRTGSRVKEWNPHRGQSPRHLTASLCVCKVAVVFKTGLCFEQNSLAPFASVVMDLSVVAPLPPVPPNLTKDNRN
ncbi:hypothetical protein FB451DRAFT_1173077 [Mycena latifolia]|nr:hypothetical protein FB451DRAFT_1173077 [Mycena latifolia]